MSAVEQLKSVLCGPDGKCCIAGSDEDRAIIDRALRALEQPAVEPTADVPLLTHEELKEIIAAKSGYGETNLIGVVRATEQLVRQKAGLK